MKKMLGAAFAALLVLVLAPAPAMAATQFDCSFSVPKPTVASKKAVAKLNITCKKNSSFGFNFDGRQLVLDVVGDDGWRTHVVDWRVVKLPAPDKSGKVTVTLKGLKCDEDSPGDDEFFFRARVQRHENGWRGAWKNPSGWINGPTLKGAKCLN